MSASIRRRAPWTPRADDALLFPVPVCPPGAPFDLAIAMITAPRPQPTVDFSLAELRRGGFPQPVHVFQEPGASVIRRSKVVVHRNGRRLGIWQNWLRAARFLLRETSAPLLLVCEDDIALCPAAADVLRQGLGTFPQHQFAVASLYTPRHNVNARAARYGWQVTNLGRATWGALAYCFSRRSLEAILASAPVRNTRGNGHTDAIIGAACEAIGRRMYSHLPSLADHTGGANSTSGHLYSAESRAVGYRSALSVRALARMHRSYSPALPFQPTPRNNDGHDHRPAQAGTPHVRQAGTVLAPDRGFRLDAFALQPADRDLFAIAMTTAPRPVATVAATIGELRCGGFAAPTIHVFQEPGGRLQPAEGVRIHANAKRLGIWRNWLRAARFLLRRTTAPYLLICQDDVQFCPAAASVLSAAMESLSAKPDFGFASLYTPIHNLETTTPRRGWQAHNRGWQTWGALALCFSRKSLSAVLLEPRLRAHREDQKADGVLGRACQNLGLTTWYHVPSLAAHTGGGNSTVGHLKRPGAQALGFDPDYCRQPRAILR